MVRRLQADELAEGGVEKEQTGGRDCRRQQVEGAKGPGRAEIPMWGLHLIDVNLVMGDLLRLADQQAKAYLRR